MQKIETNEIYQINLPALGNVTCHANLTENFKNIDKNITITETSFFKKFL